MGSRKTAHYVVLNAKGATGAGNNVFCKDYRNAIFFVATDGGSDAALTIKFQGSIGKGITPATVDEAPAFGSAQTVTNQWDYIEVIDLEDGAAIDGDTGVAAAGADDYRMFEAQINGLDWLNVVVTARTAGEVSVLVKLYND